MHDTDHYPLTNTLINIIAGKILETLKVFLESIFKKKQLDNFKKLKS